MASGHVAPSSPSPTVLFDYGEVVSLRPSEDARQAIARAAGTSHAEFWAAYWAERPDYDAGISATAYWTRVADRLGTTWAPELAHRLAAADLDSWLPLSHEVTALTARLAARGVRLALLSNAPRSLAAVLRDSPALAPFDTLFFSCELGRCKPDPAIYAHVLDTLGTAPEQTVFIDDREENVLAAKRLGIDAHQFEGAAGLEAFLAERIGAF